MTELKGDIDSISVETDWKVPACYEVTFSVSAPRSADDWLTATAHIAIPWWCGMIRNNSGLSPLFSTKRIPPAMDEWSIMPLNGLVENEIECVRFAHGADCL